MASNLSGRRGVSRCYALCVQVAADPQDAPKLIAFFMAAQGGVFRLASAVLSVTTTAPRPLGRMCRRTESAPGGGVQRARV